MDSVFDALSHPIRREILEMLKAGSRSAGELADAFPVSKPTMSGHFAKLKAANLIHGEARGASVIYSLNLSLLEEVLLGFMRRVGTGQGGSDADGV
jgi:DNA-binding transcriptional ArsR family regulator